MRIAANLSMNVSDVWTAAINNPRIKKAPDSNNRGFAVGIMFHYEDQPSVVYIEFRVVQFGFPGGGKTDQYLFVGTNKLPLADSIRGDLLRQTRT